MTMEGIEGALAEIRLIMGRRVAVSLRNVTIQYDNHWCDKRRNRWEDYGIDIGDGMATTSDKDKEEGRKNNGNGGGKAKRNRIWKGADKNEREDSKNKNGVDKNQRSNCGETKGELSEEAMDRRTCGSVESKKCMERK